MKSIDQDALEVLDGALDRLEQQIILAADAIATDSITANDIRWALRNRSILPPESASQLPSSVWWFIAAMGGIITGAVGGVLFVPDDTVPRILVLVAGLLLMFAAWWQETRRR